MASGLKDNTCVCLENSLRTELYFPQHRSECLESLGRQNVIGAWQWETLGSASMSEPELAGASRADYLAVCPPLLGLGSE